MFSHIVRFFQGGGGMMYPIAVVLVVGLAIALERWIYLQITAVGNRTLLNEISPLLTQGNFRQAVQLTSKSNAAIGQILSYGLARIASAKRRDDIEKAMEESLMDIVPKLEKRTHYLATFANLATLLGLLGTVVGLITAVPLLVIHAVLQTKTTELIDSLEMASVKFLNAVTERRPDSPASA